MAESRRERLRRLASHPLSWLGLLLAALVGAGAAVAGCTNWDPSRPFERNAPDVDRALELMAAGDFASAQEALETYLGTGPCSDQGWGRSDRLIEKHDATFDLGLVLFQVAEQFGHRFGEEEAEPKPDQQELDDRRKLRVDCALIVTKAIANDGKVPIDLRARAFYLAGNLEFLRKQYEAAVSAYDGALVLVPGVDPEAGGDLIGVDAAWNRAIALRRLQEEKEQEEEPEPEPEPEEEPEPEDSEPEEDQKPEQDQESEQDQEPDAGDEPEPEQDEKPDAGEQDAEADEEKGEPDQKPPEAEPPPDPKLDDPDEDDAPPSSSYIDRMLDDLENAPTYQEQEAKKRQGQRPVMEDK